MYGPVIKSGRRVREHQLGRDYSAVLITDIEKDERMLIDYAHLLVVFKHDRRDPVAFICSEIGGKDDEPMKQSRLADIEHSPSGRSYFLCAFLGSGHSNFGADARWGKLEEFELAALELARKLLPECQSGGRAD